MDAQFCTVADLFTSLLFFTATVSFSVAEVKLPFQRRTAQQLRNIKIRCKVTGEDFVAWETPSREASLGQPAIHGVNITAETSGRLRLVVSGNYYALRIEDVKVIDGGNYTCRGSNQSRSFTLEVDFISHGVKTPQQLKYGENGTIELGISAYPPLQYEWHKDSELLEFPTGGKYIDPYTGTLSIAKVNKSDEGNYTCRVVWKADRPHEETEDIVGIEVLVVASNAMSSAQLLSSTILLVSPSVGSSLKTETSVLSISTTRTLKQSLAVTLENSQIVNASQSSIEGVKSTSSSINSLNASAEASSISSMLLDLNGSSSGVSEKRTTNAVSSSVNEGSQSMSSSSLMSASIVSVNTSLFSVVSLTVSTPGSVSATRTLPLLWSSTVTPEAISSQSRSSHSMTTNDTASHGSSTGWLSQSMAATSVLQRETSHTDLSSSVAVAANGTSSTSFSTSIIKTVSTNVSKSVVESPSTLEVSATISASATVKSNDTLSIMQTMATVNSTVDAPATTVSFSLQPSAVLSSVGLGVNQTTAITATSVSHSRQIPSHNQSILAATSSPVLLSSNATIHASPFTATSSSMSIGVGSSIANVTSDRSISLSKSDAALPSSEVSENATSHSSRSVPSSIASIATKTSSPFTATPSLLKSQSDATQSMRTLHTSAITASSSAGVVSSMVTVSVKKSSSRPLASSDLMVSPNVTGQSRLLSKTASPSMVISPSSPVSPNKTSTKDGFIVTSYSTPCYIYYVVEKTVLPVTTANHSVIPATTPKVTLDIGSATSMHSELPTVTLTHPATVTTQSSDGATVIPSQPPSLTPETVTKVLSTDTHKVTQPPMMSSVITDSRSAASSASQAATISTQQQVESSQQKSGTVAIPFVTPSVSLSQVSSSVTSASSFTPIVATPNMSDKQNLSVATASSTATLLSSAQLTTRQESVQSMRGGASVTSTSSVQSRAFVTTVAPSVPTQSLSHGTTSSGASQVMSNGSTTVVQASEGSVLPSRSFSSDTPKTSILSNTTSLSTQAGTPTESQVLVPTTSSASTTQLRNTTVTSSSLVLVSDTTNLSQAPSLSVAASQTVSNISSSLVATVSQVQPSSIASETIQASVTAGSSKNSTAESTSTVITRGVEATKSTSSSIHSSPNSTASIGGQPPSVMSSSSQTVSQVAATSSPHAAASSSQLNVASQSSASSIAGQQSVMSSSSATVSQMGDVSTSVMKSSQVVSTSSLSRTNNQSSTIAAVPSSSGIHVILSTSSSIGGQLPSVSPSSSGTVSQNGASSPEVSSTSSLSRAANTSSAVNSASSSTVLMSSPEPLFAPPAKRRRKKRAVGDNNSTSVMSTHSATSVDQLSSASVAGVVASTSLLSSSEVASILLTSSVVSQSNNVMQTAVGGSSHGLATTSSVSTSGQPFPSQSATRTVSSSQQAATPSQLHRNLTQTAVLLSSSASTSSAPGEGLTVNATIGSSVAATTGSAHLSSPSTTVQTPSSVPMSVSVTPSGAITPSLGVISSLSSDSSTPSVPITESLGTMALPSTSTLQNSLPAASGSLGQQTSSDGVIFPFTFSGNVTSSSTLSSNLLTSSAKLGNGSSTSVSVLSREQTSSVGVAISSTAVDNGTSASKSSQNLMTSSVLLGNVSSAVTESATSVSGSKQTSSAGMAISSTAVDNGTVPSTVLVNLRTSSAVLENSTSTSASSRSSIQQTAVAVETSAPSVVVIGNSTVTSSSAIKQPSSLFGNASVAASSSRPSPVSSSSFEVVVPTASSSSLARDSPSLARRASESSVMISVSSLPTQIGNLTSSLVTDSSTLANTSIVSTTRQISIAATSEMLSRPTPDHSSQTLKQTFSSSAAVQPSSAVMQSRIKQTTVSSSLITASSSPVYRPPLVTISSLGICYVVYTTRIVQPSLVPTPQINMSSTVSVNVSSTLAVLPTVSANTSSVVLLPQSTVNASAVNATVKSTVSLSPVSTINSSTLVTPSSIPVTQSRKVNQSASQTSVLSRVVSSTLSSKASPLETSTSVFSRTPISTTEVSSSLQVQTSQVVSPTSTVTQAVSSSVSVPTTQPPDQSVLMETTLTVGPNTIIESAQFRNDLEANLAEAYEFAEVSLKRRRRAAGTTATIQSIQRLNNGNNVSVIFFVTKNGQRIPATQAAENYNRLNKGQFARLVKLDVVSMPRPLVNPTTQPVAQDYLVSLIIQDSAGSNISIPANKAKLESSLASYYKGKKNLPSSTTVTATIQTILHEPNEQAYLEFYVTVDSKEVNRTDVVETFRVSNVNLLTAQLGVQVLVPVYIPDSLTATESDHVIIGISIDQNQDLNNAEFRNGLANKLVTLYVDAKGRKNARRKRSGSTSATIVDIVRKADSAASEADVTFFVFDSGAVVNGTYVASVMNRLSTGEMTTLTMPYAVVSMPRPLVNPTTQPVAQDYLVSLIIQDSAGSNISIPANKAKLESSLASYYKGKKNLPSSTTVTATIQTILHEPNEQAYLEFYVTVDSKEVNRTDVVETFRVSNVNLLTAQLGVQVLVPVYIPDSLTATESDHVIIGISIDQNQDLNNAEFRNGLANKLVTLYVDAKGRKNARRKRSGSTSATIVDIVRKTDSAASEADVTFFVFDSGAVVNGTYVASVMNRLSTGEMTTLTMPYAVLSAPRAAFVPTRPTEVPPTVAATPIKWWIIPAVICPILLIIVIILLIYWRWKKGAPKTKVEPDTIRMLETNTRRTPPVRGFDVARYTEPGVTGMKTTAFTSGPVSLVHEDEDESEKPARRGRETSLRRKVGKPPVQKLPTREQKLTNPAYEEEEEGEEEEEDESVVSVTPTGSTVGLIQSKSTPKPPSTTKRTPAAPQRAQEPQRHRELSDEESEEESEVSGEETETEPESVAPPPQIKHSAAQLPTVAVMGEATGPPRYPPVRFRSSVHPAPSLPPIHSKQTSLVGVRVEPPSEDDAPRGRKKGKVTKRELEQRAELERQKNKQRLRDRKRDSTRAAIPTERRAWDRAQQDFDDVLAEEDAAQRVITGKPGKRRRKRPPSGSVATDEEGVPHLKSYRKLKSPRTASSTTSTRDHGKKHGKSGDSVSNASSDESEIDMNETRRRMHAMLDDAFALFGPQFSKKPDMEPQAQTSQPEGQSPQPVGQFPHPDGYPTPPARQPVFPRYTGGQPALPEPPPAHGRATEPTPGQRRRVQPTMPGYPVSMPQTPIGVPGYPVRPPVRPVVTRDPIVVWDPADRQRILNQRAPPPTYAYRDPSGQNLYITPVHQQRDDMGGLVWSPYAAEDTMDALYPDLAQASYPGALGTSPPKDASFLSQLQAAQPHDTILNMSPSSTLDQRATTLGQSPQPLIKSIKDELFRLSQGGTRKTPITEL